VLSVPCDPDIMMAGFANYMQSFLSLPSSNINMFFFRRGHKTGIARGIPATACRGQDADVALPCSDDSRGVSGVQEHALPLNSLQTIRDRFGSSSLVSDSGHSWRPGDEGVDL
jgi:hypothetical protein